MFSGRQCRSINLSVLLSTFAAASADGRCTWAYQPAAATRLPGAREGRDLQHMMTYYLIGIVAFIGSLLIQGWLKSTYGKWSQRANTAGLSGRDTALAILQANGLNDVRVEAVRGELTDHYDPRSRTVRLSEGNYARASVAGMAVAAHEGGQIG